MKSAEHFHNVYLRTNGHATVSDIRRLIDGANPNKIIPIHTMQPDAFLSYSDKVEVKATVSCLKSSGLSISL